MGWADLFLGSVILAIISILLANLWVIIIIVITVTILFWLKGLLALIDILSTYPPNPQNRFKKVTIANFFIGFSLLFTLIFTINTLPSIFLIEPISMLYPNISVQIPYSDVPYTLTATKSSLSTSDIAFSLTLIVIPTYLLSLRYLSNPLKRKIKFSFFSSFHSTKKEVLDLNQQDVEKIKNIKEQYKGLYFSFIATTMAIFYFAICFTAMKFGSIAIIPLIFSFFPTIDPLSIGIFIAIDIGIILLLSYCLEILLECHEPIDQN